MGQRRVVALRDQLEYDILTGGLRLGDRLDESALARRFAVSRTPVREALQQLAAVGLVSRRPRRGAYVAEIGARDLSQMFEVMAGLEGLCAGLAAQRISKPGRHDLQEAHQACADAAARGQEDAYYYENERFHHVIYQAAANRFLAGQTTRLRNRLKPYRRIQLRSRDRLARSLAEHGLIAAAILAGRSPEAEDAMRRHILVQGRLSDRMKSVRHALAAANVNKGSDD